MLRIDRLSKTFYPGSENELSLFDGFNLNIQEGETTAIIGGNGCGKSTLLNLIRGSLATDSGTIYLSGIDLTPLPENKRADYISSVHQNPSMGVAPSLTVGENLALAERKSESPGLRRLMNTQKKDRYRNLLKELSLGLEHKINTRVKDLSGGQRQALALFMSTMKKPKLLLLDEHTAALDPKTSRLIMDKTVGIIEKLSLTTLMISHNMKDALQYSQRIILLSRGRILLDKKSKQLTERELQEYWFSK